MNALRGLLLESETRLLRFWFGLMGIGFAAFLLTAAEGHWEYLVTFEVMPKEAWAALLVINGLALVTGAITSKYSSLAMALEGILGVAVWTAMGITLMVSQGALGGGGVAALTNIYLLMRYPSWK